nr:unnamed protein product [Callosobruchus analis]
MRFPRILFISMVVVFAVLLVTSMAVGACKNENDCIKDKVSCDKGKMLKCVNALCDAPAFVFDGIKAADMSCTTDEACKQFQYICDKGAKRYNAVVSMKCVYGGCHCRKVKK